MLPALWQVVIHQQVVGLLLKRAPFEVLALQRFVPLPAIQG
jgi:hypothetical protein